MINNYRKISSFRDLEAWKRGHSFVLEVYRLAEKFPQKEQFALTSQICRAAVSVTSNIAEGFARSSHKEKLHFYAISLGSLAEVQSQLLIARDIRYITDDEFNTIELRAEEVGRILGGLVKKTRSHISP